MKQFSSKRKTQRIFLSPSLHHVRYREKCFPLQNNSICPSQSSSYTSLNSFLKDRHLSLDDYLQLRKALRTLFNGDTFQTQNKQTMNSNDRYQQRLTSPYLQSRSNNHDQSSLPLYTDEHFIRNGLLNHNEGPDVDEQYSSTIHSSAPLRLRSTNNHFLSAMTSNFTNDNSQRLTSTNASSFLDGLGKSHYIDETNSIFIRRQKVQSWERENRLLRSSSIECLTNQPNEQLNTTEFHFNFTDQSILKNSNDLSVESSQQMFSQANDDKQVGCHDQGKAISCANGSIDQIFPMIKVLAPLIVIRNVRTHDFAGSNSICESPAFADNKKKTDDVVVQRKKQFNQLKGKRSCTDEQPLTWISSKRHLPFINVSSNTKEQYHRPKNYLMAEFESLLTEISEEK